MTDLHNLIEAVEAGHPSPIFIMGDDRISADFCCGILRLPRRSEAAARGAVAWVEVAHLDGGWSYGLQWTISQHRRLRRHARPFVAARHPPRRIRHRHEGWAVMDDLLRDLARVKVTFQLRAIDAALGANVNARDNGGEKSADRAAVSTIAETEVKK